MKNINGLGFTERITLGAPGLVEVRCRRTNEQGQNNSRDNMFWQALRGRLLTRPATYAGVTTMGVTVETGGKLAAQSDRRINVVATRVYGTSPPRSISGAFYHIGESLGLDMDIDAINELESTWWTPGNEFLTSRQRTAHQHWKCFRRSLMPGKAISFCQTGWRLLRVRALKRGRALLALRR